MPSFHSLNRLAINGPARSLVPIVIMPKAPSSSRVRVKSSQHAFSAFHGLAQRIQALNRQAGREYTLVVGQILNSGSRDVRLIEHTLDGQLDFCVYAPVLGLHRRLCRHYLLVNPQATPTEEAEVD